MLLTINGEEKEFEKALTLKQIITNLQIEDKVMAAAVNMEIVKKEDWDRFTPNDKDKLELLQFVGGVKLSKKSGDIAESKACDFLEKNGFKIIEKNFYAKKLGEIDIIALKNSTYHFCEVKSAQDYESAINNITKAKLSKLKRSINYYIQTKNINLAYTLDAIIVVDDEITYLENITL